MVLHDDIHQRAFHEQNMGVKKRVVRHICLTWHKLITIYFQIKKNTENAVKNEQQFTTEEW